MSDPPVRASDARGILALARTDRNAARRALAELDVDGQVALVCEAPVAARGELLELAPQPERLIPALPEGELAFTAKALGLADAPWVLAHATPEQVVACVDLDAWAGNAHAPDPERLGAWISALAEAGEEPFLRGVQALDAELLVLWLRERAEVWLKSDEGFEPPPGARTLDGQFYFSARGSGDDLAEIEKLLDALFREDYWSYFRLLQGVMWELESDAQEWALRWRTGRLQDLGFPTWEEAMATYGVLSPRARDELPPAPSAGPDVDWRLPIWMPRLPLSASAQHSLFRALAALGEDERRPQLLAVLALANRVAVADQLPLGDAETVPLALDKAVRLASRGLDHLAARHGLDPAGVLRRAGVEHLFRVGHSLERAEAAPANEERPASGEPAGLSEEERIDQPTTPAKPASRRLSGSE
ncbi:MAG TPA: DUF6178 family protein [Myxococcota bacterium]|nr:DUF6178 family protein [Myxococcota bacterium]